MKCVGRCVEISVNRDIIASASLKNVQYIGETDEREYIKYNKKDYIMEDF